MNSIRSSQQNHPGRRSIRTALFAAITLLPVTSTALTAEESAGKSSSDTQVQITNQYDTGKTRYVHMAKCLVRSGPAEQHYATSQLEKGARVEVYLETSDGWSGIRPPQGSHNWIPASSAYLLPGGKTAEIVEDETAAWVGSETQKPRKLQWQTGLVKSQTVSVLGEEYQLANDGEKKLWYQIAPPQGEFRWVRTSQLSDLVGPTSNATGPTNSATPSPVQTASFESKTNVPTGSKSKVVQATAQETSEGEIVWSNEAEVLQQVNRQIESEQSVVKNELRSQGIEIGSDEMEPSSVPVVTKPAMTAAETARAKRHKAAAHQIDSIQHWNAIQESNNPKLRVGPVSSLLGLVGLSVVEAERQPVQKGIAQARHAHNAGQMQYGQSLQHVGPVGSRLDRLPRPGRRPSVSSPHDGMPYSDPMGNYSNGEPIVPIDNNQPVLSRLWSSNQPVFGNAMNTGSSAYAHNAPVPGSGLYAMQPTNSGYRANQPGFGSYDSGYPRELPQASERSDRDWHGIRTNQSASVSNAMKDAFEDPLSEAEFGTPEIQRAMLDLSRVVSKPTEQWELDSMRRQCQTWIEQGGSAIVRGEARLLLDRIERFESLRVRTLGMMQDGAMLAANEATNRLGNALVATNASAGNSVTPASAISSSNGAVHNGISQSVTGQGDASGWLVQVLTSQPGQPEYALTDDAGNVVSYVQSTASLNLRRYLQQPVMVHGARGYIPSLAAKQIVAERVVRLR